MTVTSVESSVSGPYAGNGKTAQFPYAFLVYDIAHIVVIRVDRSGKSKVLTLHQDYSVQNMPPQGGEIVLSAPLLIGNSLIIMRNVPALQDVDLQNQGQYFPEDVERALDQGAMHDQQQDEAIQRALRLSPATSGQTTLSASSLEHAHKALIFNEQGDIAISITPYEDHAANAQSHTEAANAAQEAARETITAIRQMLSAAGPWPAFGSWPGVSQIIDCGLRFGGGMSLDLGNRFDREQVIDCGWRVMREEPLLPDIIDLGYRVDDTYLFDCGTRNASS